MGKDRLQGIDKQVSGSARETAGKLTGDMKVQAAGVAGKSVDDPGDTAQGAGTDLLQRSTAGQPIGGRQVLELHAEAVMVSKRVRKTLVRATRTTRSRDHIVEEDLARESVVVERVAINQVVDAVPPIRQEGDVTILPVVEEVVVVERRLVLKEEVHLRRVRTTERYNETVALREQDVSVTRTNLEVSDR